MSNKLITLQFSEQNYKKKKPISEFIEMYFFSDEISFFILMFFQTF